MTGQFTRTARLELALRLPHADPHAIQTFGHVTYPSCASSDQTKPCLGTAHLYVHGAALLASTFHSSSAVDIDFQGLDQCFGGTDLTAPLLHRPHHTSTSMGTHVVHSSFFRPQEVAVRPCSRRSLSTTAPMAKALTAEP